MTAGSGGMYLILSEYWRKWCLPQCLIAALYTFSKSDKRLDLLHIWAALLNDASILTNSAAEASTALTHHAHLPSTPLLPLAPCRCQSPTNPAPHQLQHPLISKVEPGNVRRSKVVNAFVQASQILSRARVRCRRLFLWFYPILVCGGRGVMLRLLSC
jgi:hypothetical protein